MSRGAGHNSRGMAGARREADAAARGIPLPRKPARKKPGHIEDDEQEFIFQKWAPVAVLKWPQVALLHAIPNGGTRNKLEAWRLTRQGVKAGVLDLDLPVPRYRGRCDITMPVVVYLGLRIELKRPWPPGCGERKPDTSPEQKWWMSALQDHGHCVCLCYGAAQAIDSLEAYLTGELVPNQWSRK